MITRRTSNRRRILYHITVEKKIYEEQKVHAFQVQEMEDIFGYQLHKITAVVDGSGKICIVSAFL